ncbi:hypothetical protein ACQXZ2_12225, partial [Corynebacterium diphtheriae]
HQGQVLEFNFVLEQRVGTHHHRCAGGDLFQGGRQLFGLFDQRAYPIRLAPFGTAPRTRSITSTRRVSVTRTVLTGVRPGGSSSRIEVSRSA